MTSEWHDQTFLKPYNNCKKQQERGQLPSYFDCLTYANRLHEETQQIKKRQLEVRLQDRTFRYLYKMCMEDKEEQKQDETIDLW